MLSNFQLVLVDVIVGLFELHCWGCIIQSYKCIHNKSSWGVQSIYALKNVIQLMINWVYIIVVLKILILDGF